MKCPHLSCLVYHDGDPCTCDMSQYCQQCKPVPPIDNQSRFKTELLAKLEGHETILSGSPGPLWDMGWHAAIQSVKKIIKDL